MIVLRNVGGEPDLLARNAGIEKFVVMARLLCATLAGVKMLILNVACIRMRRIAWVRDVVGVNSPHSRLRQDAAYGDLYTNVPNGHLSTWHERRFLQRTPSTRIDDPREPSRNTGPTDVAETAHSNTTSQSIPAMPESRRQSSTEWQPLSSPTHSEQQQQQFSYIANGTRENDVSHPTIEVENGEQQYEEISPRVVGSSSAFGFIENMHEALRGPSKRKVDSLRSNEIYDTVSHFGTSYWNEIHSMNPIFHEQIFMKRYNRLFSEGPTIRPSRTGSLLEVELLPCDRIFQATLNLALAIVYLRTSSGTPNDHETAQEAFFDRAERLLTPDLMQLESLQLVQALVLKATYLREADMSNRSWIAVGVAIRTAQAIGLYVENNKGSQAEREQRRRVWYACVIMDRTQSMTYGRPPMITGIPTVSHPKAIDDEYLSIDPTEQDRNQPPDRPSRVAFFVHTLRLSDVASRIRQLFYGSRQEPKVAERCHASRKPYAEIIELDADLGKWYDQVPNYLLDEDSIPDHHRNCFIRQRISLRCQFLHWRLVLFRGLLVDFARESSSSLHDSTGTPLQIILSRGCVEICIHTAQRLLDTIEPQLGTDRLPAGWFIASFHLYNIGAIIALSLLSPGLRSLFNDLTLQDLQQAWWQCLNCLKKCDRLGVRFAQGCIIKLRRMFEENEGGAQTQIRTSEAYATDCVNESGTVWDGGQRAENPNNFSHSESFPPKNPQDMITSAQNGMVDMWWTSQDLQWMNNFDLSHLETNVEEPAELRDFF
ncbi:C6 transcription factor, putative [Talaromyces marneffei ATCC 18224]|uniref:C6 transcription factor, putative n=1 Tax=Talaromyces marneffei (strain ATCC 18224 / CBS 334.59 / QM 7333) TaxID=441960 RepID=B6QLY9_TALMQ|nr:C6 transcription factor, putative [Talaromyces marneffei ATCC 18224]